MKKIFITLLVFGFVSLNSVLAYNASEFSSDAKIISALNILEHNGEYEVFNRLHKNGVKIKFESISGMGAGQGVYAASTYDNYGRRVILINSIYRNVPSEQIACLIAHESCHVLRRATLEEETIATQKEAMCWTKLKKSSTVYPQNKLTKRLDKLANMYLTSNAYNNKIATTVSNSGFYRSQYGM